MKSTLKDKTYKDYFLLILGLFVAGVGVAITKKGGLGVSPLSSIANVMSIYIPGISLGNWLIVWNCILIAGQIIVLRRNFQLFQLLQIPLSFLFGYFTDFGTWMMHFFNTDAYVSKFLCVIAGTAVLALGISITVSVNVIMNSGEAFVKAVSDTINKDFGNVKIAFDIICVTVAIILSLILFHGQIVGTREGTVFAAIFTGVFVKFFMKHI